MHPQTLVAFEHELVKIAYGNTEHTTLARTMSTNLGQGKTSPAVQNIVQKGALQVDKGMRHPWLPHTDPLHSFPGSQSPAMMGKNVVTKQQSAVGDIAKSIAGRQQGGFIDRTLSGARAYRGLKNLGEGHHQMVDISSHAVKPVEQNIAASSARAAMPRTGYGGGLISGFEHLKSKISLPGAQPAQDIDALRPEVSAADRSALARSERMGSAVPRQVSSQLQSAHGMTPQQAEAATHQFFTQTKQPNILSRAVGEASRDARYLGGEVSRAGTALRQGIQGVRRAAPGVLGRFLLRR